ncbi:MAG: NAD(P)/FAD-dependent oxidoreductase [Desulfomonilaceae bacterium]
MSIIRSCISRKGLLALVIMIFLLGSAAAGQNLTGNTNETEKATIASEHHEIVVLGGGMAGLTAAYFLKDRDVVLLEKSDHFGGRISSGSFGGFSYPQGPAYIGIPQGPIETMINELALEPLEIPEPSEGFYYDGKVYFGAKEMAGLFAQRSSAEEYHRFVSTVRKLSKMYEDSDYSALPEELAELDRISAKEWFEKEKFPPIFMEIYESQALGLFGSGLARVSALSFIPEIGFQFESPDLENHEKDSEHDEETPDVEKESGAFTFESGLTELPEAIAKKLGDKARLDCAVTSIKEKDKVYEIQYVDKSGREGTMQANAVIVAVPAPVALEIAAPVLTKEQRKILGSIQYAGLTTVTLFSDSPIFDRSFNLGVGNGFIFTDLYDSSWVPRAYDPERNKNQERALCAYVPDSANHDGADQLNDQQLIDKVIEGIEKIFPGSRSRIKGHDVKRVRLAYPIMPPGGYERLARLNDINQGKFLLAGDYMIYPTLEASAESGYLAAARLDSLKVKPSN